MSAHKVTTIEMHLGKQLNKPERKGYKKKKKKRLHVDTRKDMDCLLA